MNRIEAYMITPIEIVNVWRQQKVGIHIMEKPYIESISREADECDVIIDKIARSDFGICSKEIVSELNRKLGHPKDNDTKSHVILFYANVLQEKVGEAIGV